VAAWDDGYVTDVTYTTNMFREATPIWLAMTALMMGQRPPDLARPFRYADLGCGHGLTAIGVAATCPHAEVWGFDFNPAHIESAQALAPAAGLTNVRFEEASFADLAQRPASALLDFDFMVSHGVLNSAAKGRGISQLVSPVIGSGMTVDLTDALLLRELADGKRPADEDLIERLQFILGQLGHRGSDGVSDTSDPSGTLQEVVRSFFAVRHPAAVRLRIA